jgi:hypothetical protein
MNPIEVHTEWARLAEKYGLPHPAKPRTAADIQKFAHMVLTGEGLGETVAFGINAALSGVMAAKQSAMMLASYGDMLERPNPEVAIACRLAAWKLHPNKQYRDALLRLADVHDPELAKKLRNKLGSERGTPEGVKGHLRALEQRIRDMESEDAGGHGHGANPARGGARNARRTPP